MPEGVDETMGAIYIGAMVAGVLFGASFVQLWHYFNHYQKDFPLVKLLVTVVVLCDTAHQILITHTVYTYLVSNYSDPSHLSELVWSLIIEVYFNGFIGLLVQSFFTYRIYQLSGKNILLILLVASLVLSEFVVTIVFATKALRLQTFTELDALRGISMSVNALAAAGDVVIAASMCTLLHFSRTGFRKSDTMINRLMMYSLNTGLLTSLCAVLSLITIAVLSDTAIYICFYFILGRLYTNSLLATLNARTRIRGIDDDEDEGVLSIPLSRLFGRSHASQVSNGANSTPNAQIAIKINTTREYTRDSYSPPGGSTRKQPPGGV